MAATDTLLKNLLAKKTEIESVINLEKSRVFDEVKKRDALTSNLDIMDSHIKNWENISQDINKNTSDGVFLAASEEIKKLVNDQNAVQEKAVALFRSIAQTLDV